MNVHPERPPSWDDLEASGDLAGLQWQYVAPADACPVGRALDGRRFASLAEVYEVIPELGQPNPACPHPPSCACTVVPTTPAL